MRLEAGGTLLNFLQSEKTKGFRAVDKIHILQQLARGVAELHEAAVVHGDIKSSNIFLTEHKPALVRLGDFGEAVKGSRSMDLSVMQGTFGRHGTLRYNAPEMLAVDSSGLRAKPTRKTDVYAFGLVCHEVLCREHKLPFEGIANEAQMVEEIAVKGTRPNMADIQSDVPESLKRLIEACWSVNRKDRPTALECYMRIDQCYNVFSNSSYDIFFSHPWTKKPVLRYVKRYFNSVGYKVWYDEDDMQWDLVKSMQEGVSKSKVVLACISRDYEKSRNCMFELAESCKLANKPIIALSTDADPFSWAGQNQTHGDLKQMCGISGQGKLFFDIGEICARPGWDEPDEAMIPKRNITDLVLKLDALVRFLRGSQINCMPSL